MLEPGGTEPTTGAGVVGRAEPIDGMRGIGALQVMIGHCLLLAIPVINFGYLPTPGIGSAHLGTLRWLLLATPLRVITAGDVMVVMFFIASGYVLTLPAVRTGWGWLDAGFFLRRALRLYPCAWVGLLLGVGLFALVARHPVAASTAFLAVHAGTFTSGDIVSAMTLFSPKTYWGADPVIWTLRWEMWWSVTLPLALAVPLAVRGRGALSVACGAVALVATLDGHGAVYYFGLFECGAMLAFNIHRLPRLDGRRALPIVLCIVSCVLMTATYWVQQRGVVTASGWPVMACTLGVCIALWLIVAWHPLARLLASPVPRWLGARSYPLYLLHMPIAVTVAFVLGGHPSIVVLLAIVVPTSIAAAHVCHVLVEKPFMDLGRSLSRRVNARVSSGSLRPALAVVTRGRTAEPGDRGPAQ